MLALVALLTGPAVAVPTAPSEVEINEARQAEQAASGAVESAEQQLAALTERLDELAWSAARAAEDYNGARFTLAEAQEAERTAAREARLATAAAEQARIELGRVAAATYRVGGQFANLALVLEADGPEQFLDGTAALHTVTRSQSSVYQRAADASAAAAESAADAELTVAARQAATAAAEQAFEDATAAAADLEVRIGAAERERNSLVAELAAARGTTTTLEEERQAALAAEAATRRARDAHAADADAAAQTSAAQEATGEQTDAAAPVDNGTTTREAGRTAQAESAHTATGAPVQPAGTTTASAPSQSTASAAPAPSPTSAPAPVPPQSAPAPVPPESAPPPAPAQSSPPPAPPPVASGADRAIAYARAQLGKPYQWGGAGPDAFDCSGLTMRAWQQGGKQLPHWSVAQARMVTRVSYAELRPGDLIFWSDNGQPSGTYHVGLYIGNGQMIHAPRPGKVVEVQRVFYWRTPSFYGRV
ncbi:MAG TPA: NlpC/P60 family protein [Jiangellaceae bacterium]|nr:NlpC/P60 family protein [Jiangellaceae bacterium]